MRVKHNVTAMNANRMLGITTVSQAKVTEKLSSGYKINRAADDAAGLAISEKMRKQVRGLTQASSNAQDGISTVQTADGALNEVHDMLHRLTELTVKASNGTLSETDREAVQNEVNELVTEIDRIANTTKFNETSLLRGTNEGEVGKLTYNMAESVLKDEFHVDPLLNTTTGTFGLAMNAPAVNPGTNMLTAEAAATTEYSSKQIGPVGNAPNEVYYVLVESTKANPTTATKLSVSEVVRNINSNPANTNPVYKAFGSMKELMTALKEDHGEDIKAVTSFINDEKKVELKIETFADVNDPLDLSLHVGTDSADDNKIYMNISQLSARALGLNGLKVSGKTGVDATASIETVNDALLKVSRQRSALGAIQNRLEHTISNLDNVVENTTSAESQIRDTDMASAMVTYSNNSILAQAGQAMLTQANQSTQGVLSLLQ